MEYRKLGRSNIEVSVISMGCWAFSGGWRWGHQSEVDSIAAVREALALGVNMFDTAEAYGHGVSEEILGRALQGRRHDAIISTKVSPSHLSKQDVLDVCEASLQRLNTDYIDLFMIHWPSRSVPLSETMEAMARLREQGKVREIGVSNFGVQDLSELLALGRCEANQLPYNLLTRSIEYGIRDLCIEAEMAIVCYIPLLQGLLAGSYTTADEVPPARARSRHYAGDRPGSRHGEPGLEDELFAAVAEIRRISEGLGQPMANVALAWLLHQPGVTSVLVGARNGRQAQRNVEAADLELSTEILDELAEVTEQVKQKLGSNPDMWQSDSRCR